jgi:HK97 family phage portal protein
MKLLDRVMSSFGYEPTRDVNNPRMWGGDGGNYAATGVAVTDNGAQQLDVVQAAMEAIAGPASSLPVMVIQQVDDDEAAPQPDHRLSKLLNRPNVRQTRQEFLDEAVRNLAFYRNVYIQIVSDGDEALGSLELIHPRRKKSIERRDGRIYYTFRGLGQLAQDLVLRDDAICHIRKAPLSEDGLEGLPIHQTGLEAIGLAIAVKEYGARFFKNSGRSGGVLKHPGNFKSKEDEKDFLETWRSSGTGANAHKDRLLKYGVDYEPIDVQNDQAQFIETVSAANAGLCRVMHNIQQHRVQILDKSTNNNIEQQSIEFVAYVLGTFLCAIQEGLGRDLLLDNDDGKLRVEFNVLSMLDAGIAAQFQAFAQGRQWGWLSVNDIRKRLHMNPIDGGDEYLRPLNMAPVGSGASEPVAPTPPTGDTNK